MLSFISKPQSPSLISYSLIWYIQSMINYQSLYLQIISKIWTIFPVFTASPRSKLPSSLTGFPKSPPTSKVFLLLILTPLVNFLPSYYGISWWWVGKFEGRRRRGCLRMRWLDSTTNSMDMSLSTLGDSKGQGSMVCCSPWGRRVKHDIATERLFKVL